MRYAILADIHGNLPALEAVLSDIEGRGGVDEIWCLGDIVGYGPDPHSCIELLRQYKHVCVAGNHDWAAIGKLGVDDFNPYAAAAALWTARQLSTSDIDYLKSLPLRLVKGDFTLVHGSPREPIWEYILSPLEAAVNFEYFSTPFCLVGHSHVPLLFRSNGQMTYLPEKMALEEKPLILNPGGVGQPRDGDPRASYAIYDEGEKVFYHFRIPYDIATTQRRMMEAGLPLPLALRLSYGR